MAWLTLLKLLVLWVHGLEGGRQWHRLYRWDSEFAGRPKGRRETILAPPQLGRKGFRKEACLGRKAVFAYWLLRGQAPGVIRGALGKLPISKALFIFAQASLSLVPKTVPSEVFLKMKWRCFCSFEVDQVSWVLKLILEGILFGKTHIYTFPVQSPRGSLQAYCLSFL